MKEKKLHVQNYLEHISNAIVCIEEFTKNVTESEFLKNIMIQHAVICDFERIGEASKNIERVDLAFIEKHSEISWAEMYALRNQVAHGYFSINFEIIWSTIKTSLPELKIQIEKLLQEFKPD